jgi:uncharacterized membrane-anchored protein
MTTGDVAGRLRAPAQLAVSKVPEITAWFWIAKVASTGMGDADWLGVPASVGGLAWGRGVVALVLTVPILIAVAYMAVTHVDVARRPGAFGARPARARHRAS